MSMFTRTALAAALLAVAPLASAATDTDTMTVSITIENSCTVDAGDMTFGTQTSLATALTTTATVSVDCTNQGPITVAFDGDPSARQMDGPSGATINYELHRDAARTEVLGSAAGQTLSGTSTGGVQNFTVYGRVPAGQGAKPVGAYTDTVTATLTF
jgi:spore coat protein U-like protein